jgi:stalled ribosome rescue protein Dom34
MPANPAHHKQNRKRIDLMKKRVGLWIDHRKAIVVIIKDEEEEIKKITSNMEKHVRFTAEDGRGEDVRDRRFENHLNDYYDEVIAYIRDADSIQIFGPGEAKGELEKRIEHAGLKAQIAVETVDKMTDGQIAAKVREHFLISG